MRREVSEPHYHLQRGIGDTEFARDLGPNDLGGAGLEDIPELVKSRGLDDVDLRVEGLARQEPVLDPAVVTPALNSGEQAEPLAG